MLGSRLTSIAYPMLVLTLTNSPVDAGWAAFAATAPSILVYLPAGALIDRLNPRTVMLRSEAGRGFAIVAVVIIVACHWRCVPVLIVAGVVEEVLEVFSMLAERRLVGCLSAPGQASSALVRVEARTHVVLLAGRPLGGLLFEFRPIFPFLADVVTFVVSVAALLGIKDQQTEDQSTFASLAKELPVGRLRRAISRSAQPPGGPAREWHIKNDIAEGLKWLGQHRFARAAMTLSTSTTLICQALIMAFIAQVHAQHLSSMTVGIVLAASGLGGVLGSGAASLLRIPSAHSLIKFQMLVWTAAFATLAFFGGESPVLLAVVIMVLGFMGAMGNIEVGTYFANNASNKLARVASMDRLTTFAACAVGPVLGGFLFQCYGIRGTIYCLFGMIIVATFYSLAAPSMHASERRTAESFGMHAQAAR